MSDSRFMFRVILGLAAMLFVTIVLLVVVWTKADDATSALKANVQNQVRNRTINVATWCGAINAGRDYDRAFIHHVTRGRLSYTLGDLDCAALEAKTLASTRPH